MPTLQEMAAIAVLGVCSIASADDFDRLEGRVLADLPTGPDVTARPGLSIAEIGSLPNPFRELRSAVVIVKTSEGNLTRLLLSSALRKPKGAGEPVPVLVIDRFETFESGSASNRLARGRDVLLFDGFRYDLDTGQVVPEGQGGDLLFSTKSKGGPSLVPEGGASLFTLEKSPFPKGSEAGKPSPGRLVLPTDFDGRYALVANGQWSGTLDLKAGDQASLTGKFRSDQTGNSYKVTGFVTPEDPNLVHFAVELPMARLEFDGRLWTLGKGAMAGTATLLNRNFGFVAIREGGKLSPDPEDVGTWLGAIPIEPNARTVTLESTGKYLLEGQTLDPPALLEALTVAVGANRDTKIILKLPPSTPFATINATLGLIRTANVETIRVVTLETPR